MDKLSLLKIRYYERLKALRDEIQQIEAAIKSLEEFEKEADAPTWEGSYPNRVEMIAEDKVIFS